jgi:hypothetical protein
MIMVVALLGGCSTVDETDAVGVPEPVTARPTAPARPPTIRTVDPQASGVSCTNRIDYAGDTRSNAEINSLGEQTGTCPKPRPYRADTSCTNWIDYAGDPRANAEINSEGERTGSCPLPQK